MGLAISKNINNNVFATHHFQYNVQDSYFLVVIYFRHNGTFSWSEGLQFFVYHFWRSIICSNGVMLWWSSYTDVT